MSVTLAFSPSGRGWKTTENFNRAIRHTPLYQSNTPFSIAGPSQELLDLFNNQVTQEFMASQLYLSASIWFDAREWGGMSR